MYSTSLQYIDGFLCGVVTAVGDPLPSLFGNIFDPAWIRQENSLIVPSIADFEALVEELRAVDCLQDECPYADFLIRTPPPIGARAFNWSALSDKVTLYAHQKEAIEAAITHHRGRSICALEPGEGKTLVGCDFSTHFGYKVLVICPASMRINWRKEYVKGTGRSLKHFTAISFEMIKNRPALLAAKWDAIIVDECHFLKNENKRSDAILPLLEKHKGGLILLSGTLQENCPAELYNQLHAVRPDVFTSRETFMRRYADGQMGTVGLWEERGATNKKELTALTKLLVFRSVDITVKTPIRRSLVYVNPTSEQCVELEKQEFRRVALSREQERAHTFAEKQRILLLRKAHALKMWRTAGLYKAVTAIEKLVELVTVTHPTEKVIVFCYHLDICAIVKAVLDTIGPTVLVTGSTTENKRQNMLDSIREVDGPTRFGVLSIRAIGVGINLAPGATVVVFMELHHVPSKMKQAEKRAHRIPAVNPVSTYWLMLNESHDDRVLQDLVKKEEIISAVLDTPPWLHFHAVERPAVVAPQPVVKRRKVKSRIAPPADTRVRLVNLTVINT
jgi:SWI/SNF-related matrix-associated actin-dependent regulator 1 of chromatin subfamily A